VTPPEPQLRPVHAPAAAVFVDAGWLLAAAGLLVLGSARRDELSCNYPDLMESLSDHVERHSGGMRRLRTYWYDGAVGGLPTWEHNRLAGLPYVTVRLGRLSRDKQQKGVDVLIYRDLMRLARERAIARAYLLSGDEDLREGVAEAKEFGVQVILLGMPIEEGQNQSAMLVRECDEYVLLPGEMWKQHFTRRSPDALDGEEDVAVARSLGEAFARRWAREVSALRVQEVLDGFPTLPQQLDIELIVFAEGEMGSLRQRPDLKQEMRGNFWYALRKVARGRQAGGEGPPGGEGDVGSA
jgi:uncharacterized LabA/DUF88 family protein